MQLPQTGYLRLHQIIGDSKRGIPPLIPLGRSTWLEGVKKGLFPKSYKISSRISAWKVEDILALIEKMNPDRSPNCGLIIPD